MSRRLLWPLAGMVLGGAILYAGWSWLGMPEKKGLTKERIAQAIESSGQFFQFPTELELDVEEDKPVRAVLEYSFEPKLQQEMESLFRSYRPDYGAFVALDAKTGKILSLVSYTRDNDIQDNLALRATFPAASIFKVVTAAAAIEGKHFNSNTVISFNGRNHTLYRNHILKTNVTRWTRYISLKNAFALSVNTVFGRIGAYEVGSDGLREYAGRFGFNREIASDIPVQKGSAPIPDDAWGIAEAASGFTRDNTMSPLQGALMAAAVVNNGVMMEPYAVEAVYTADGMPLYTAEPKVAMISVDERTSDEIREMMEQTITHGTSRKAFRGFFRRQFTDVDVGGKTGSLTGTDPFGKYDWFVGFAEYGGQKIALASLTIHEKYWKVKSSYLARRAIERYFGERLRNRNVASNP